MRIKKVLYISLTCLIITSCFTGCKKDKEEQKKDTKKIEQQIEEKKEKEEKKIVCNAFMVTYTTTKEKGEKIRTCMSFAELKDFVKDERKILKTIVIQDVHVIGNEANYEKEIDASELFKDCNNLEIADFSLTSTERYIKVDNMFLDCISLKKIYISDKWDLSNAAESKNMFKNCISLKNFNTKCISSKYATDKKGYLTKKEN